MRASSLAGAHGARLAEPLIRNSAPPMTLQLDYVQGPMVVIVRGDVSYEWGTPVE